MTGCAASNCVLLALDAHRAAHKPLEPQASASDFDLTLRQMLARAIRETARNRDEIATAMSALLSGSGVDSVTRRHLDSWSAPSQRAWRFPMSYMPSFIEATGAAFILEELARRCGYVVVKVEDAWLLELGRVSAAKIYLANREREIGAGLSPEIMDRALARGRSAK